MEYMFMPLRRYADFSGRSRRMEYWMWILFIVLLDIAFWVLLMMIGGAALMTGDPRSAMAAGGGMMIVGALFSLVMLALIIPGIAVAVRRLHDTNRTGWWVLAPLVGYCIAFLGGAMAASGSSMGGLLVTLGMLIALGLGLTLLVFMFLEGTKGPNRYGADPKGGVDAAVFA
ncbi:MAG: hypothetical protein QOH81_1730 [Sphingomonadales bacterium]|jgi:uncharacterized membrane protein YhaH (DUF805 family)|nr:hypothetical protein [Sphingomonadales bacterium]